MNLKLWLVWLAALLLLIVGFQEVKAGTGAIFKGDNVYLLKNNLRFKTGNTRIMTGDSDNPVAVAKSADIGSMYLVSGTSTWYVKDDDGTSTNWGLFMTTNVGSGTDRFVPVYDGTDAGRITESSMQISAAGVVNLGDYASSSTLFLDENKDLTATQLADGQFLLGATLGNPQGGFISGTANQVTVVNGSNTIQLSLPQDIDLAANPTFSGVSLTSLSDGSVLFVSGTNGVISEENSNFNWNHTLDILDINGSAQVDNINLNDTTISTLGVNEDLLLSPSGSGLVSSTASIGLTSQTEMRFYELPFLDGDYVGFSSPDSVSTTTIWKLPPSDGAASYTLATDGAGNLAWKPEPPVVSTVTTLSPAGSVWFTAPNGEASSSPYLIFNESDDELKVHGVLSLANDDMDVNGARIQLVAPESMTVSTTYYLPPTDGTASQTLSTGGNGQMFWETVSVAAVSPTIDTVSNTVEFTLTQANTFAFGEAIYHDGASWVSAQADSLHTLAEYVVVSGTTNVFTAMKFGKWSEPSHGLEVGEHYFLSATTAGGNATIEGAVYSAPIFYVEDSNTVHIEVYRPSLTPAVGTASGSLSYELLVGDETDVIQGSANFSTIAECLSFATDGNKCILLGDRTFDENITISDNILIEGYGNSSIISGTVTFATGSTGASLDKLKIGDDITVNTGVKNVVFSNQVWVTGNVLISGNAATNYISETSVEF